MDNNKRGTHWKYLNTFVQEILESNFRKLERSWRTYDICLSLLYTFPSIGYHQRRVLGYLDLQCDSNFGIVCKFHVQTQGGGTQSLVAIRPRFWQLYPSWYLERSL